MQRYFVSENQINEQHIAITGDDYHHIVRVMRMKEGDNLLCSGGTGLTAWCEIEQITNESVIVRVIEWREERTELPIQVYVAHGLPKADKLELVIQKGTELGAFAFIPFLATRSIVKWEEKKAEKKLERWQKIAKEAAEQAHRASVPRIYAPMTIQQLIEFAQTCDYRLVAYEEEAKNGEAAALKTVLRQMKQGQSLFVVFGPEGGFAPQEMELFLSHGFLACGLGPRILRTETAPLYVLAAASYEWELK